MRHSFKYSPGNNTFLGYNPGSYFTLFLHTLNSVRSGPSSACRSVPWYRYCNNETWYSCIGDLSKRPSFLNLRQTRNRTLHISRHLERTWHGCIHLWASPSEPGEAADTCSHYDAARFWGFWASCRWIGVIRWVYKRLLSIDILSFACISQPLIMWGKFSPFISYSRQLSGSICWCSTWQN